jgi:hypothetical protein
MCTEERTFRPSACLSLDCNSRVFIRVDSRVLCRLLISKTSPVSASMTWPSETRRCGFNFAFGPASSPSGAGESKVTFRTGALGTLKGFWRAAWNQQFKENCYECRHNRPTFLARFSSSSSAFSPSSSSPSSSSVLAKSDSNISSSSTSVKYKKMRWPQVGRTRLWRRNQHLRQRLA